MSSQPSTSSLPPLPTPARFEFPYAEPYDIQVELMRTVFRALEDGKIAIVESPTGTGKSLTLLTATLTWLRDHEERADKEVEESLRTKLQAEDPDDPPWVIEHALKASLDTHRAAQSERLARLAAVRNKERQQRLASATGAFRSRQSKKVKVESSESNVEEEKDEEFLPEDNEVNGGEGEYLSVEVRALMARYDAMLPKTTQVEEKEEDLPKIYFASRTHTQLRQLTSELLKTTFVPSSSDTPDSEGDTHGISTVPLGSRKQLCINDKVRALARNGGDERMNEACLDMQKSNKARCEFLPKSEDVAMLDARDAVLAEVRDIEDIVQMGRKCGVCPYYSTRRAVKQAQLVTLPYNLLLQKNAREALDIDLKGQVVVIDEAHNLIDTILSIHSTTLTHHHLTSAISQLQQYLSRFKTRLKPIHTLWIRQTLSVLTGLSKVCLSFSTATPSSSNSSQNKSRAEMMDVNTFMARAGGSTDQVNLMNLVRYLKESKLARKVSGFTEKVEEDSKKRNKGERSDVRTRHAAIAAFHLVESFLLSLTDAKDDGRVILSEEGGKLELRYILLNPAERFREVVEQVRSVVLAGGTMEPINDFLRQLFPFVTPSRIITLSCSHVIPKSNLLTQVVSCGPRKIELEFKYSNRSDDSLLAELGSVILSTVGLVPDGIVVFLPSYSFLDKIKHTWTSVLPKLAERKHVFYEPQTSGEVETVLRDYSLAISTVTDQKPPGIGDKRKGALLFAVVGGKLSEGINFSDKLGRCVIMVGLPFANIASVELSERMKYVSGLPGAGPDASKELYENLCMRAVNQSIGRAIRHANDYACILLVDKRYASQRIRRKLPKWIREDVQVPPDWAGVARGLAGFFREKREREGVVSVP
ncbi:chromosome transmission fidelity protein 1 [Tremella mesenterica]|uniref:ATP-dependent DNA helicase CHL1 n=1 Tax=Tremella mesenterica TaxID=5217 RepID=A0A4Q1BV74_TREME|nr:chromosome transmission fidelity protein 1 [Tremella mesenterica]